MMALLGSIGTTMIILACALPAYNLWWPIFVVLFYILCPIPTVIAKRSGSAEDGVRAANAMFATIGIVLSSYALPIVLARTSVIHWGACMFTLAGNSVAYLCFLVYYFGFDWNGEW